MLWRKALSDEEVEKMWAMFGSPPVLSSEDAEAYNTIRDGHVAFYRPRNQFHLKMVRELVDTDWEIFRLFRDRTTAIERRIRTRMSEPIARLKCRNEAKAKQVEELTHTSQAAEAAKLKTQIWDAEAQIEQLQKRRPDQLVANAAVQDAAVFFDSLDKWLNHATARRNSILKLLEYYCGPTNENEITEADCKEVGQEDTKQISGPPAVPTELIADDLATQNANEPSQLAKE
jgi:hypothetical protein